MMKIHETRRTDRGFGITKRGDGAYLIESWRKYGQGFTRHTVVTLTPEEMLGLFDDIGSSLVLDMTEELADTLMRL